MLYTLFSSRDGKFHVTSNLVHRLYHAQNFRPLPLTFFKSLVTKEELRATEMKQRSPKTKTWFTLTISFLRGVLYKVHAYLPPLFLSYCMSSLYIINFLPCLSAFFCPLQHEIGDASAAPQRKFYKKFPNPEYYMDKRVDDFVSKAVHKVTTDFKSELKKLLPIADPIHTPRFLSKVKTRYESHNIDREMKLEKLWMLSTSAMYPSMKIL